MAHSKLGVILLVITTLIFFGTAIAHLSCLVLGPECYSAQLAPPILVDSARKGTLLAPIANLAVSSVFIVWSLYTLSAAGVIRRLIFLKPIVYTISFLCIVRGLLPLQLWLIKPEKVSDLALYYGWGWLVVGLLSLFGIIALVKPSTDKE